MSDRRSRQKEQRAAKKAAEKKQEARRELRKRLTTALGFGAVVVGILVVTGFFSSDGLSSTYENYRSQPTACDGEQPPEAQVLEFDTPEVQTDLEGADSARAIIDTSCGPIEIDLDLSYPATVNSFVFLARSGYFHGQVFHRILADFYLQGGDPNADGTGGPGYRVPDEFPPTGFAYEEGVVAMANRGKGTTGSQFFIVVGDSAGSLLPQFNILGTIVSGQEALDLIEAVNTARRPGSVEESLPLETVYINSVTIEITGS